MQGHVSITSGTGSENSCACFARFLEFSVVDFVDVVVVLRAVVDLFFNFVCGSFNFFFFLFFSPNHLLT